MATKRDRAIFIRISERQERRYKDEATARDISLSELIRRALDNFIDRKAA